jgi:two-component sensor histidine kinase
MANSLSSFGMISRKKADFPKALEYFYKSLSIYETLGNKIGVTVQQGNIGQIYDFQGEQTKALEYFFKALKNAEATKNKHLVSVQYQNIATIYNEQEQLAKSEEYYLKSLAIDKSSNYKEGIAINLTNLASLYSYTNLNKSLVYYLDALVIFKEIGNEERIAECLLNIGAVYTELKQKDKAQDYLLKAIAIADKLKGLEFKTQLEKIASEIYMEFGNDKQAFIHYKRHIFFRDSIHNAENTRQSMKTELDYEFEKKQAATKFENDKIIYQLNADNKINKQQRMLLIIFISLTLVLLFFVKRAYDTKKKYSEVLSSENERKELLLQEVHHRVNNSLQMISSLLALQANNTSNEEVREYLSKSESRIQAMSTMHEMLHENNTQLEIDIEKYILKLLDFYKNIIETSGKIKLETNLPKQNFHSKIALPVALIVNELVTNAIKYGFPGDRTGTITISLIETDKTTNMWALTVVDNGVGLPDNYKTKQNSLGLRLVAIMTKQLGGTLNITNQFGSRFEIIFKGDLPNKG